MAWSDSPDFLVALGCLDDPATSSHPRGDQSTADSDAHRNRAETEGAAEAHERLIAAVSTDPAGDGFLFDVSEPTALEPDQTGRPGWRFSISADLVGRNFATV